MQSWYAPLMWAACLGSLLGELITVRDAQAQCANEFAANIVCSSDDTNGVGINTAIDTTMTVDPGVTVSNGGTVINFGAGGAATTNTVNNNGTVSTRATNVINGGSGPERRLDTGVWLNLEKNPLVSIKGGFLASFLDGTETFGGALRVDFRFN